MRKMSSALLPIVRRGRERRRAVPGRGLPWGVAALRSVRGARVRAGAVCCVDASWDAVGVGGVFVVCWSWPAEGGVIVGVWRNWQTRQTQNLVGFGSWGFDSPLPHSCDRSEVVS